MKNLSNFVVKVTNQMELDIALRFYRRATRRALDPYNPSIAYHRFLYVGMTTTRTVLAASIKYHSEQVVAFKDIGLLADTPTRARALKASGFVPSRPTRLPEQSARKPRPVVRFNYPTKSGLPLQTVRKVELIKADDRYYVGLEVLPDNKFQFKKFLKSKATNVEVLTV